MNDVMTGKAVKTHEKANSYHCFTLITLICKKNHKPYRGLTRMTADEEREHKDFAMKTD